MSFSRIHLTGALGYIGSNLKTKLSKEFSCPIQLYDYQSSKAEEHPECLIHEIKSGNCEDDFILHFGAVADTRIEVASLLDERNVKYTMRLAQALEQSRARLIFASSAAVYGNTLQELPVEEADLGNYAQSKLLCEKVLMSTFNTRLNDVCILRLHNVYGPFESVKGSMMSIPSRFVCDALQKEIITIWKSDIVKDQARDFIHIEDVVEFVCILLQRTWTRPIIDCGTGRSTSVEFLAKQISGIVKCRVEFTNFPSVLSERAYQVYTRADTSDMKIIAPELVTKSVEGQLNSLILHYSGTSNH